MKISELIELLTQTQKDHGDLEVFAVASTYEYIVEDAFYAEEGPLTINADRSQPDLPERFVVELALN